ncbi:hypothetical protein LBW12_05470 [Latilactobacillus curvatus]|uniref:FlgT C-terminal domain-containing protein n=1 Tax=Latilactobacillus curvatus TaxID=28038 RepID=UPI0020C7B5A2|nr:FlgT C-terminal domain-containing protein [Latilactobacillus curvatus]MCP8859473.1 hypothetical protein [Latilactobacillus curvatus]
MIKLKKRIQIIKIISRTEVIINAGSREGIKVGDAFNIVDTQNGTLKDPFTDEVLGHIEIYKNKLKAQQIFEKYSILSTLNSSIKTELMIRESIGFINNKEQLNVDKNDIQKIDSCYSHSRVMVGDRVIHI